MDVKALKELLADVPDDHQVELGTMLAIDLATASETEAPEAYKTRLDFPVIGIAVGDKDLTFIVGGNGAESMAWLQKFGEVSKVDLADGRE